MEKIPFKVSARAGKLLGRENFSNPEGAIIELVKNSYDADSQSCLVIFDISNHSVQKKTIEEKLQETNESIWILDNGEGMSKGEIENHWMKIGTSNKEDDFVSNQKRVKTGAKGIGRFALDRLGYITEMWTVSRKTRKAYYWKMDWRQFDSGDNSISDITAELTDISFDLNTFIEESGINLDLDNFHFDTGTVLKISQLKDDWDVDNIQNVFKSLEALVPPKELEIGFDVSFYLLQDPNKYGKVETAYFNDYDYKVIASYDSNTFSVNFEITRNELDLRIVNKSYSFLYEKTKEPYDINTLNNRVFQYTKPIDELLKWELNNENRRLLSELGSFDLTFYYLKFNNSLKEEYPYKAINQRERRTILDKFGGVKIYRDSFRVRPYGDPDNDWLKLGARVAQSPAGAGQRVGDWRVRPEQTAGIITISRKNNPLLVDKSDRGALQENDAYETFKNIIIKVIHEFEVDRSKILNVYYKYFVDKREQERENELNRRAEAIATKILEKQRLKDDTQLKKRLYEDEELNLEAKKDFQEVVLDAFKEIESERVEHSNEEIVQVRGLASLGLIVSSFAHELKEIKNNVDEISDLETIYNRLIPDEIKREVDFIDGINIIKSLKLDTQKITHWIEYSLNTVKKDKRKRTNLDLSKYFDAFLNNWSKVLMDRNITLKITKLDSDNLRLKAFEMDMHTIFGNLISNSIDSFQNLKSSRERKINIDLKTNLYNGNLEINYEDNGVGLSKVFLKDKESIFRPFTTSKVDKYGKEIGTGLGMYLVKNVIDDYNGDISIFDVEEGFKIIIVFPNRKV